MNEKIMKLKTPYRKVIYVSGDVPFGENMSKLLKANMHLQTNEV